MDTREPRQTWLQPKIRIVNFYVAREGPGYRGNVRIYFKDFALKGLCGKGGETDFGGKAQLHGIDFFLRNLRRHQDSFKRTQFDHNLIIMCRLIRIYESLEHDAINGRSHLHVFKRDLRLPESHSCLGQLLARISKCNLRFLQIEGRAHMLFFEGCIALDLPRFVFDFDIARFDKLLVGFERCLNQSIVPADKKVSFFDDIANLHRDLKDSSTNLCGKEDGVELLHRAAASDDFFKRLSAHRNGFHGRRRMHQASLSSVGADHVKNGHEHEQTKKATDDQEDQPVGTEIRSASRWAARMPSGPAFHPFGCELETAR